MRIYTRRGDAGKTSVIGARVAKDHIRVEAYGTVDEANSFVGDAIASMRERAPVDFADVIQELVEVQQELFDVGGDLAVVKGKRPYKVSADYVTRLENKIDIYLEQTPAVKKFILPGGTSIAAALHICRTVVRRAERRAVTLSLVEEINDEALRYLNRISDLFFVLGRVANARENREDDLYVRSGDVFRQK
ncbi:cob(I)yrinic acid a,c-diamide adenosyltransferase [Marininema halotolerans]|uniref:Corrinoid adenosyltransferase n=1 Tax=Marininema halotolerans TaxID=1155944 RepID=A0A1I6QLK8_9BACL|nr:cob(I)yrinic acid a,c-diamide adenosyltransferase [Marininema halotolerans]SFS53280.1 cob(I)alamin adenosyltransferase [Marininema halotolerans]